MKPKVKLISLSAEQLVEHLDKENPHRCIDKTESITDAHRRAGRRELIDHLLIRMKQEKEKNDRAIEISV